LIYDYLINLIIINNNNNNIMSSQLVYYDFETTGLNPFHDEIIEYAFLNKSTGRTIEGLVKPETPVSNLIQNITKITNTMLEEEKPISGHIKKLEEFLNRENLIFVAHNGNNFDQFFLKRAVKNSPILAIKYKTWKFIDSIHLSKIIFPKRKSHSLANLCKDLMITPGTHRAMADVEALDSLFHIMLTKIVNNETDYLKNIYENPIKIWEFIY